jgi:type VI secretion system protein ImpM
MHVSTQDIALFGKLPDHGDFIRHHATGPLIRAMDDWLRQGLYLAKQQRVDGHRRSATQQPTTRFFFDPGTREGGLLGALHPSRDRVGRTFPFLAAVELEADSPDAVTLLPVAHETLLIETARMVHDAAQGAVSMDDLARDAHTPGRPVSDARARYDDFLRRTTLQSLWERLWGYADDSRTYLLVKNLLDIVLPLRSGVPSRFSLVLRFPLSATEEDAFEASFWMHLVRRLVRQSTMTPSFFLVDAGEDAALLLSLRPPPDDLLMHLFDPQAETENVCRLEQMGSLSAVEAALAIPSEYGTMIESESLTLRDMLDRV